MVAHNFHSDFQLRPQALTFEYRLMCTGKLGLKSPAPSLSGIFRKRPIMNMVRYGEVYEVHWVFRNFAVLTSIPLPLPT
jgi:hypothetical protein